MDTSNVKEELFISRNQGEIVSKSFGENLALPLEREPVLPHSETTGDKEFL